MRSRNALGRGFAGFSLLLAHGLQVECVTPGPLVQPLQSASDQLQLSLETPVTEISL